MKYLKVLLIVIASALYCGASSSSFRFDYSYGASTVSGVLTASDQGSGVFLVTDATGDYLGTPITGVFDPSLSGNVFYFNNLLYFPAQPSLDINGIVFELAGNPNIATGINLYWDGSGYRSIDGGNNGSYVELSIRPFDAPTSTPEPGTWALMSSGLLGVAGTLRRKLLRL
jgi:hypothetical protein